MDMWYVIWDNINNGNLCQHYFILNNAKLHIRLLKETEGITNVRLTKEVEVDE